MKLFIIGLVVCLLTVLLHRRKIKNSEHIILKKGKKHKWHEGFIKTYVIGGSVLILLLVVINRELQDGNFNLGKIPSTVFVLLLFAVLILIQQILERVTIRDSRLNEQYEKEEQAKIHRLRKEKWDEHTQMQRKGGEHESDNV